MTHYFHQQNISPRTNLLPPLIRQYEDRDRAAVAALWRAVFPNPTGRNDPDTSIDRKLRHGDRLFFVAEEDGQLIGTAMAGYDGHRGWLYSLAVAPGRRRNGLGTLLVEHVEKQLAELGCPKLNLQVLCDNASVVAFYQSLGYAVEERISMGKLMRDR